jgi:hypothetical protein
MGVSVPPPERQIPANATFGRLHPMDPRGLRARLAGADCTSCGAAVPADRITLLADRGDLAFVELSCTACGSQTLSVVLPAGPDPASRVLDTAGQPERRPAAGARRVSRPPLTEADVVDMHRYLGGWTGDLRSLLDGSARRSGHGSSG